MDEVDAMHAYWREPALRCSLAREVAEHTANPRDYMKSFSPGRLVSMLIVLVALSGCAGMRRTRADAPSRYPAPLVAAWATVSDSAKDGSTPDTALWIFRANGQVERREVRVRMNNGSTTTSEHSLNTASWWREHGPGIMSADTSWVICTSQRPGRNRQCGRVSIDTVSIAARATRRLRWDGLTFRSQRWVFTER